jgi:hypothetical protein
MKSNMNCKAVASLVALAMISIYAGCATNRTVTAHVSDAVTTMELSGTEGASFTGYYIVGGEEVQIAGILPKTISERSISRCEFRKANSADTLTLVAKSGKSFLTSTANPGTIGIKAGLETGGWNVQTFDR